MRRQRKPNDLLPRLLNISTEAESGGTLCWVGMHSFNRESVTAFANVVMTEPMHGLPRFEVGVAVPEAYRGKGHAKSIVAAAIAELRHGLARNNISSFYVEAIVSIDNEPSKRVAAATISATPVAVTDRSAVSNRDASIHVGGNRTTQCKGRSSFGDSTLQEAL
jgi:hypothetical protein